MEQTRASGNMRQWLLVNVRTGSTPRRGRRAAEAGVTVHLNGRRREEPPNRLWLIASICVPLGLLVVGLMVGFGLGTSCTTAPGRSLSDPPCDVVNQGV